MRVLQLGKFYYPYMGGIENHLFQLCNELKGVVTAEAVVANSRPRREQSMVEGVPVTRCAELAHIASTSICPTMSWELSTRQYDVLHLHFPHPMGAFAYLTSRRPKPHALVITHHSDVIRQPHLVKLYEPFMQAVFRRADAIVCTSPNYRDTSSELAPHRHKCEVVPYGIDLQQFRRTAAIDDQVAAIRQRYGGPLLLAVGRLIYYKGFEYLIEAMAKVDAQLLVIGGGPLRQSLEDLARTRGVASRVHFLGNIHNHDITPYYFAADVYVLPSIARSEAFAIVQLEAMACGLPVINTALDSGVPYVSRHGESGLTVKPRDSEELASAVRQLLADADLRRRLGAEGRRRVESEFTKERMAQRVLDLYSQVVHARRAA